MARVSTVHLESEQGANAPSSCLVVQYGLEYSLETPGITDVQFARADSGPDVLRHFSKSNPAILVLGPSLDARSQRALLDEIFAAYPDNSCLNIVTGVGSDAHIFQDFVDKDRIYYLSRGVLSPVEILPILASARRRVRARLMSPETNALESVGADRLLDLCAHLSVQTDFSSSAQLVAEAVRLEIHAHQTHFWIYDPDKQILLRSDVEPGKQDRPDSVAAGLLGFVARTGEAVQLDRVDSDPRFDPESDNPGAKEDSRFFAMPVPGTGNTLIGVLSAVRPGNAAPFSAADIRKIEVVVNCAAPLLDRIRIQARLQNWLAEHPDTSSTGGAIFRQEALENRAKGWENEGEVLRTYPAWLARTHWITVSLVAAGIAFMSVAKVNDYASGPAVIRASRKVAVTTQNAGIVKSVSVAAGSWVRSGEVLASYDVLFGRARHSEGTEEVRAAADGLLSALRLWPGKSVDAGEPVAAIIVESSGYQVLAGLPAADVPFLRQGMPIALRLNGYSQSLEEVNLLEIGREAMGPRELARELGSEALDGAAVSGPVVVVRATMQGPKYLGRDGKFKYLDGTAGRIEVKIGSVPMIVSVIPALKKLWY